MAPAHTMAPISIGTQLVNVKAYHGKRGNLRVGLVWADEGYVVLSELPWFIKPTPDLKSDEFIIENFGSDQIYIKEVREQQVFIDTGKRVQINTNLWGEVWRLKPEHLALLQEKETQDAKAPSEHQSEH
jgi:hypothetical protein